MTTSSPSGGLSQPASPTVRRKALANALRRLRSSAGLHLEDAAKALEVSVPTISRYEKGVRIPRARDVRELCRLYGLNQAETEEIVALVSEAKETGWWEDYTEANDFAISTYIGFENAATQVHVNSQRVVPGLLQTPGYAQAIYAGGVSPGNVRPMSEHDVRKMVEIRMKRQERLRHGLQLFVVLDEGVARRAIGGIRVMRDQLQSLIESCHLPAVTLRILPFSTGAHPGLHGEFTILSIPHEEVPDIVYLESLAGFTILDGESIVGQYRKNFSLLFETSLSEEDSVAWLSEIVTKM